MRTYNGAFWCGGVIGLGVERASWSTKRHAQSPILDNEHAVKKSDIQIQKWGGHSHQTPKT